MHSMLQVPLFCYPTVTKDSLYGVCSESNWLERKEMPL